MARRARVPLPELQQLTQRLEEIRRQEEGAEKRFDKGQRAVSPHLIHSRVVAA